MFHCGQRVGNAEHKVELGLLPVLEPLLAVDVPLPDERVQRLAILHVPALDERGVDRVSQNVTVEPGIELHEDARDSEPGQARYDAGIVGLAPADGRRCSHNW